jgi:hypothetical protein
MNFSIAPIVFDDVGNAIFSVARITLALLVLGLLASAAAAVASTTRRADDLVYESMLDLDRASGVTFYELYRGRRPKNVTFAWLLSVITGPIGAFAYMQNWRLCALAVVTLNGFGAWWIESWFSVPALVMIENRANARWALEQLPYVMERERRARR